MKTNTFIENVNTFLSEKGIKKNYLSLKTGIEINKLSRILNGVQEANVTDIEMISDALGQEASYFLSKDFIIRENQVKQNDEVVFYAGEPSEKQAEFAKKLLELLKNADAVLGAKARYVSGGADNY